MKEIKDLKLKDKDSLSKLDNAWLNIEIKDASKKLYVLKMKKELGELKQTHLITFLRKYIAKLNTLVRSI